MEFMCCLENELLHAGEKNKPAQEGKLFLFLKKFFYLLFFTFCLLDLLSELNIKQSGSEFPSQPFW